MYFSAGLVILFLSALVQGAPSPMSAKTAVSPDGYRYVIEDEPYVSRTLQHEDGTTSEMLLHPRFAEALPDQGTSPNLAKRLAWLGAGTDADMCGASSFNNKSSGGSPFTRDCAKIRDYYRSHGGFYAAAGYLDLKPGGTWTRLVITDSCVFGVRSGTSCILRVGNTDMADLTGDAINKFGGGDRIGAEGSTKCSIECRWGYDNIDTDWALFRK